MRARSQPHEQAVTGQPRSRQAVECASRNETIRTAAIPRTMAVQWADTLANSTATHKVESPVIDPIERGSEPMIWFEYRYLGTQAHRTRAHERARSEPHAQAVTSQPRSEQAVALVRQRCHGPTNSPTRPPRTKFLAESWT